MLTAHLFWAVFSWFLMGYQIAIERARARWLPWYQRYLPCLIWGLYIAAVWLDVGNVAEVALVMLATAASLWNDTTARRNRDRGDDQREAEAAAAGARLTEVQQAAFQREARAVYGA